MITAIRTKIRALVSDFANSSEEAFIYTSSAIFTIAQENITITQVTINGVATSGYTYSSTTNKITISASLTANDVILVSYTYYNYSSAELDEYIRAAIVWISIYSYDDMDYELESGDVISPTPDNKLCDLISFIAAVLIKPDYNTYRTANQTVIYPRTLTKEQRIEKLISHYNQGLGISDTINFDDFDKLDLI